MNLQLKFIVLAFSAFTLVNAASSAPIDDELAAAASNVLRERKIAEVDDKHMSDLKKELGDVAESACKVGLDGFAREFKRGFNYVFSNENVEQASCFLTRVHDEVPVKFLVGAGLLVADSMLTGFFLENPAQAVVVSGFAFYA